ncbi:acetoacetate decarboxylase family protein [Streptomyces sp. 142MFCol3.1]|uniref:acetoacetate decarboxylase family protein n=1 Tax=Streptomyces sp. 142MFCol3.1 TaxID=1172179 RepID=UPI00048C75CC|nr:acetoacetate decarboxylase family protein [Streptomyces sp. 142MFCol3.1]
MTPYPEQPWHLAGQMYLSLWLEPRHRLPSVAAGTRPVTVFGRGVVGAAWVVYEHDSVLHYNELLRAVLVRDRARLRACITDIWVDNEASMAGGRALWGIPKELAVFDVERTRDLCLTAEAGGRALAMSKFSQSRSLPGRWPLSYKVTQTLDGRLKTSQVSSKTALTLARARWTAPADSPLNQLARRPPLLSLALRDFSLSFGA